MTRTIIAAVAMLAGATAASAREPVIDMHLHALAADFQGPPPLAMCTPIDPMPTWDARQPWAAAFMALSKKPPCANPVWSPATDAENLRRTLAELRKHAVIAVLSGDRPLVAQWRKAAPDRLLAADSPDDVEAGDAAAMTKRWTALKASGELVAIAEIGVQYGGIGGGDGKLEPLWRTAVALDTPVGLHVGPGPPGTAYFPGLGRYRARDSSPLLLEDVLVRHPRLRLYLMHAGFPLLDDTLALLYAHPQVYVDLGVIIYTQPRAGFYRYLRGLVEAGFGERVMFGSDQMIWPETIGRSIAVINDAPFLTKRQKRDILYNNAARFLRLDAATIARHHAM